MKGMMNTLIHMYPGKKKNSNHIHVEPDVLFSNCHKAFPQKRNPKKKAPLSKKGTFIQYCPFPHIPKNPGKLERKETEKKIHNHGHVPNNPR